MAIEESTELIDTMTDVLESGRFPEWFTGICKDAETSIDAVLAAFIFFRIARGQEDQSTLRQLSDMLFLTRKNDITEHIRQLCSEGDIKTILDRMVAIAAFAPLQFLLDTLEMIQKEMPEAYETFKAMRNKQAHN